MYIGFLSAWEKIYAVFNAVCWEVVVRKLWKLNTNQVCPSLYSSVALLLSEFQSKRRQCMHKLTMTQLWNVMNAILSAFLSCLSSRYTLQAALEYFSLSVWKWNLVLTSRATRWTIKQRKRLHTSSKFRKTCKYHIKDALVWCGYNFEVSKRFLSTGEEQLGS